MRNHSSAALALLAALALSASLIAQDTPTPVTPDAANPTAPPPAQTAEFDRPVSLGRLVPNILTDQPKVWLFPAKLTRKRVWIPTAMIIGATAALIAADPHEAHYFRTNSSTFSGFNSAFSGTATTVGTAVVPVAFYAAGLLAHDSKARNTALLAAEAVADSEILSYVLKDAFNRARPSSLPPTANFSDTFFDGRGSLWRGRGAMPSGHAIAAFSVATIVARRYGNHRWVPYVSYGLASLVGLSRVTLSEHFVSDVFVGAALGYSVSRFAVLRQ